MSNIYKPKHLRFVFDPFEKINIKRGKKTEALNQAKELLESEILDRIGDGESPVAGERWKKSLSKEYKKRKGDVSSDTFANMELFGDMLDSLRVRVFGRSKIAVEIKGEQAEKADGHNKLTGRPNKTIKRRFIPGDRQKFKREIMKDLEEIGKEFENAPGQNNKA